MTITIEAVFQNGVLKPKQPLTLTDGAEVRCVISNIEAGDPLPGVSRARQTAGLLRWTGDPAHLERLIMDPDLDLLEGP